MTKTTTDTFTQGGQTQLHKLRMIAQVTGSTMKASLGVFLLAFALLLYMDHVWQDLWFLLCYGKAHLRVHYLSKLPTTFWDHSYIVMKDGPTYVLSDHWIVGHAKFQRIAAGFTLSIIKKLFQSMCVGMVAFMLISWYWVKQGQKKKESKILSGFTLVSPMQLKKIISKKGASPYHIGDVPMPLNAEFQHLMVTGTTGSGKSNMIHHLLKQIRAQGDQAIVVDTTGGIFSRFYKEGQDILLNPLDARSHDWNMWEEISSDPIIDEIAESMVPEGRGMETFWVQSARQIFAETIKFTIKKKKETSYDRLVRLLLKSPLKELQALLEGTTVATFLDPSIDKTALSIRATLATYLRVFQSLDKHEGGLSLLRSMEELSKNWIFLSCTPDQREYLRPLFSAWLSLVIKGIMRRDEQNPHRTWIIVDELPSLNKLPSLLMGLAELRKYGGCLVLGFQDLSQLEKIYGQAETKTISNLTGSKVLFRCMDSDVARRVSRYLGEQEKLEANESISFGAHQMRDGVSLSDQKKTKPVVSESDIMKLKDLECFLKFPGDLPIAKMQFDYLHLQANTPKFIAAPPKEKVEEIPEENFQENEPSSLKTTENRIEVKTNAEVIDISHAREKAAENDPEPMQETHASELFR